jgi:crotonobetainyl-CoA:carnitine CoA-transferase CaiB-like acyl-CoA transferase
MTDRPFGGIRPLEGVRVVDAATILAGPFAASILGEFGAEVVKVEQPGVGDPMRRLGTPGPEGDTYWWWSDTRNKTSVELDLRDRHGADRFRGLVGMADVLIENYRTGTMEAWGLGFERLRLDNPGLVQLSVSGYGRTGPFASTAGVARIAEAFAGMSHLTGEPDRGPGLSGSSALADYVAGLYGAFGVLLALESRRSSGRGQMIDVALYDGIARFLDEYVPLFAATGAGRERMGGETHRSVPHNNYEAADGRWVTIACTNDKMFDRLADAMGRGDLLADERFATNAARIAHRPAVNAAVAAWVADHLGADVVAICERAGVPAGVVQSAAEYLTHPQVLARDSVLHIVDERFGSLGSLAVAATLPRLLETPGRIDRLGATLGEVDADEMIERWRTPHRPRPRQEPDALGAPAAQRPGQGAER